MSFYISQSLKKCFCTPLKFFLKFIFFFQFIYLKVYPRSIVWVETGSKVSLLTLLLSILFSKKTLPFPHSSVLETTQTWGSVGKNPPANAGVTGDLGSVPGLRSSLGEIPFPKGNPLQYSLWFRSLVGYSPWGIKKS